MLVERRHHLGRVAFDPERHERGLARRRHDLALGEQLAAAGGYLRRLARSGQSGASSSAAARPASDGAGIQPESKRRAPSRGDERAGRLVATACER